MKTIGIVGGMGPYASLDLARKVLDLTSAADDHDHLPIALISYPHRIPDRTQYLLGKTTENPARAIFDIIRALEQSGAQVVGIPCNTAHAAPIFDVVCAMTAQAGCRLQIVHMIEEVGRFLKEQGRPARRVGLLATQGTYRIGLYESALAPLGFEVLSPEPEDRRRVQRAIYDQDYGIKPHASPVTSRAGEELCAVAERLRRHGAEAIIAGCTEIPLALTGASVAGLPLIDPTAILARALIRESAPEKLGPDRERAAGG